MDSKIKLIICYSFIFFFYFQNLYSQTKPSFLLDPKTGNYNIQYQNADSLVRLTFEPTTKINPKINCQVINFTDSIQYIYSIKNLSNSKQRLGYFELLIQNNYTKVHLPSSTWVINKYSWNTLISLTEYINSSVMTNENDGIAPDSTEIFTIVSEGLPIISDVYFKGLSTIYLSFPDLEPPEMILNELREREKFPGGRISKKTIIPKCIPNPFDPLAFTSNLISMGDEADLLDWISPGIDDDTWDLLKTKLQSTYENISNENYKDASKNLKRFLKLVDEYYKSDLPKLNDEAYALFKYNGEYLFKHCQQQRNSNYQ